MPRPFASYAAIARRLALATALATAGAFAVPAAADHHAGNAALSSALEMDNRSADRARDQYRHPAETLEFFRVKPGMTVIDYMPASGWYTRVLVPYLGANGRYIGLTPDPAASDSDQMRAYFAGLPQKFTESAGSWNLRGAPHMVASSDAAALAEYRGKVDRALIFREMHNLHRSGALHTELSRIHAMLADDGMLGIVQHRARDWAPAAYTDGSNGYMRQSDVIGLVEAHGFELVETSEINANPRDSADHEGGVWQLPPVLRDKNEALKAVGESDRMTLLFRKR